jgi:hypothetical protein
MGTVVGAGVLLLVTAACATTQQAGAGAGGGTLSTAPSSTAISPSNGNAPPPEAAPPNGGKPVAAEKVDGSALGEGYPRSAWVEGDGTTLGVMGQEGGCGKVSAQIVEQSASSVHLELVEALPLEKKMCTMDLRYPPLTVTLGAPLGDRKVVLTSRQEQK